MQWVKNYDLYLFDFDGLLVNTEEMHYTAYRRMLKQNGIDLSWDFNRYCQAAHYQATALKEQIYSEYPDLFRREPTWEVLYKQKQEALLNLVDEGAAHLMPGVEELLVILEKAGVKRAVVTHSPDKLIQKIRAQNPLLNTIPTWITREFYEKPKPDPECYIKAIEMLKPNGKVIGFEDTPRGLSALLGTDAEPILICTADYPEIPEFIRRGAKRYLTLKDWLNKQLEIT
ncbi:MAG: HAD family hydrolase [Parachlamydiaceae bacterium]